MILIAEERLGEGLGDQDFEKLGLAPSMRRKVDEMSFCWSRRERMVSISPEVMDP